MRAQEQSTETMPVADSQAEPKQAVTETPRLVAQDSKTRSDDYGNAIGTQFVKHLWSDQIDIWTSPSRLHWEDGQWLVPFAFVTGGLFATDRASERVISGSPTNFNRYLTWGVEPLAELVALGGGTFLMRHVRRGGQMRETYILSAEAILDSLAVSTAGEYALGRERPNEDASRGRFFAGGTSFPSNHAAIAWSAASVLAHEYPGPLTEFLAYGTASAISASRVLGKEHFPSDVFVGSAMGWMIGREVYRKHHSSELDEGGGWESLSGDEESDQPHDTRNMGSPFVPLDSWVYPALEKLAALGYVSTAMEGLRPWTRIACARIVNESKDTFDSGESPNRIASELKSRLEQEFSYEITLLGGNRNLTANVESIYARTVSISGPPLTDSFHFGQTISYDFGRPFERGINLQDGGSFSASAGPITFYMRAEYQHAPGAPAPSPAVINVIAQTDLIAAPPDVRVASINRPELLDTYLAVNLGNWEISLGRQSLDWGPGPGGSLLWSNNIEPANMVRFVNPEPFELPGFLRFLGPARLDQFFGRLEGHHYITRPFMMGQKINFKPIPSIEIGFGRTLEIGGKGPGADPITSTNVLYGFFGQVRPVYDHIPGHTQSEMDWTFYVPGVRNYIVFYGDVYAADDFIPWQNPPKNPFRPGIYITHFPKLPNLDLHIEAASTESSGWNEGNHGNLNYWNFTYRDGSTYNGFLIGNTVGRMGRAIQSWLTYQVNARNSLQFTYKHNSVSPAFIPQGGYWQDYAVLNDWYLRSGFYLRSELQYEHISSYPILFSGSRENVSAILEVGFSPNSGKRQSGR
ncbi:MAG TPA: capsule assembly Wzi family protein [Candidatus Acidoferrales bacterium]